MKFTKSLLVMFLIFIVGAGAFAGGRREADRTTVMLAGVEAPATGQSRALIDIADILNDSGRFNAAAHVAGALSTDPDHLITQARTGIPVVVASDPGRLASMFNIPDMGILMAPFILNDPGILPRLPYIPLVQEWQAQLAEHDIAILAFKYNGFRSFYTTTPVRNVADLRGLRIRSFPNETGNALARHLGFANIGMPWGEVAPALHHGAIDGCEVQVAAAYGAGIYEVARYLARTNHFMLITVFVTSHTLLNRMSPEDREFFIRTVRETALKYDEIILNEEEPFFQRMRERGVTINEVDIREFQNAMAQLHIDNDLGFTPGLKERLFRELGL